MKKTIVAVVAALLLVSMTACALAATGFGAVGTVTNTAATAEKNGSVSGYIYTCAVTVDDAGKIVGVVFDAMQPKGSFDTTGAIVGEEKTEVVTKLEIGEGYGMKKASSIGKEWYEHMAALEAWCIGKTVDEVLATPLDDNGKATDADLVSGCTVHINAQLEALAKAAANAK